MLITRDELAKIYQKAYSDLENHYALGFNEKFVVPKFNEEFLMEYNKFSVSKISHIPHIRDCELRAWKVSADINWNRGLSAEQLPKEDQYRWSIGWLSGVKMPFGTEHTIITVYSDLGIKNIDPLTDTISEVDTNKFNALLLVM